MHIDGASYIGSYFVEFLMVTECACSHCIAIASYSTTKALIISELALLAQLADQEQGMREK